MSTRKLDELIWTALTDSTFHNDLLNGRRRELLTTLDLTEAEREAALAVQANTLEAFARALCRNYAEPSFARRSV